MAELEFDNQRKDEEIILMNCRHPWVLARAGLILMGVVLVIILSFLIFGASLVTSIVLVAGLLFAVIYGFIRWFVYTNDVYIVTNQRIINVDQSSFFARRVSEAELSNVLNVSYEIKGLVKSFLNFGDVSVDTSGSDRNYLVLENVENPHFIQEKIVALQKKTQGLPGSSFANKNVIR